MRRIINQLELIQVLELAKKDIKTVVITDFYIKLSRDMEDIKGDKT